MHHKQTERYTLYRFLLLAHHAADTWLAIAQHHYKYDRVHAKWQLKTKTNCSLINQSDWHHAKLGKKNRIRLKKCQGQHWSLTEHKGETDAGQIGSISILSACWLTEGGGGGGSMLYQWMQVAAFHSRPQRSPTESTELKKGPGQPHPSCRNWLALTHTPTHHKEITTVSPCRNPGLQQLGLRDPMWTTGWLKPQLKQRRKTAFKNITHALIEKQNNTEWNQNEQPGHTKTLHTYIKNSSAQIFGKNPDLHKVNMRKCCCDSQHAAVAPGAISLSQPLSHSTGRGEHRRISTLGKKIRASDSNLPCIILSLRSSRALLCWQHKHHSNCCGKKVVTSVWLQVAYQWEKKG